MSSIQHASILFRRLDVVEKALQRARAQQYPEELIMALARRKASLREELERVGTTGLIHEQVAALKERERMPVE